MKERPILFNGDMVRAVLGGTKTQTRRVYKNRKHPDAGCDMAACELVREQQHVIDRTCSYGQPGDRLWVREAWSDQHPLAMQEGRYSQPGQAGIPGPPSVEYRTIYRADGEPLQVWRRKDHQHPYHTTEGPADEIAAEWPTVCSNYRRHGKGVYWRPSIHMPRWASRITLEIVSVRVERLRDISEADAIAEGAEWAACGAPQEGSRKAGYAVLWESINGAGSWDANPWVWVVEFRRVPA